MLNCAYTKFMLLLSSLFFIVMSFNCIAADTLPSNQNASRSQPATKSNTEVEFFSMSRENYRKYRQDKDPFAFTTIPFALTFDLVMSPSLTSVKVLGKAGIQKHAASWNNPSSMMAKATEN